MSSMVMSDKDFSLRLARLYNTPVFSSEQYSVMAQSIDGDIHEVVIYARFRAAYTLKGENARIFVREYGDLHRKIRDASGAPPRAIDNFQDWRWNKSVFHPFLAEWVGRVKVLRVALQVMDIEHPEVHNI